MSVCNYTSLHNTTFGTTTHKNFFPVLHFKTQLGLRPAWCDRGPLAVLPLSVTLLPPSRSLDFEIPNSIDKVCARSVLSILLSTTLHLVDLLRSSRSCVTLQNTTRIMAILMSQRASDYGRHALVSLILFFNHNVGQKTLFSIVLIIFVRVKRFIRNMMQITDGILYSLLSSWRLWQ